MYLPVTFQTLKKFGERCLQLDYDFRSSEAFSRSCLIYTAHNIMDSIEKSLNSIESEAQVGFAMQSFVLIKHFWRNLCKM